VRLEKIDKLREWEKMGKNENIFVWCSVGVEWNVKRKKVGKEKSISEWNELKFENANFSLKFLNSNNFFN
jgi:hypothetical protein